MIGCAEAVWDPRTSAAAAEAAMSPNFMFALPEWLSAGRTSQSALHPWNATFREVCAVDVAASFQLAEPLRQVGNSTRLLFARQGEERSRGARAAAKILLVLFAAGALVVRLVVRHVRNRRV